MLANPTEAALSPELAEAVGRARDFAKASKAQATRKAYAADLRDFTEYCKRIGALSLPADPAVSAPTSRRSPKPSPSPRSAGAWSRSPRRTKTRAHPIRSPTATYKKFSPASSARRPSRKHAKTQRRVDERSPRGSRHGSSKGVRRALRASV